MFTLKGFKMTTTSFNTRMSSTVGNVGDEGCSVKISVRTVINSRPRSIMSKSVFHLVMTDCISPFPSALA